MNCNYKIAFLTLILAIFLVVTTFDVASAQWRTQHLPTSGQDRDLSFSPSKGPDDAPVEIAVFSCFQ